MRSGRWYGTMLGLVVTVGFTSVAWAQPDEQRPSRRSRDGRGMPGERNRDPVRAGVQFAEQLRDAVKADLKLDETQQPAVSKLFEDHLVALRKLGEVEPDKAPSEEAAAKLRDLERQVQEARDKGDREQARELARQLRELRDQAQGPKAAEVTRREDELIKAVSAVLKDDQVAQFQKLAQKLRAQSAGGGPGMRLMRGVRQALTQLELSDEQRTSIGKTVRETVRGATQPGGEPLDEAKLLERVRADLEKEVGAELAGKFTTALEKAMQEVQAQDEGATSRPARKRGPGNDAPEPPPPDEQ